jgi:hypothetical protein
MSRVPNDGEPILGGDRARDGGADHRRRRDYESPAIVRFGSLGSLARFGGSQVVDSGGGLGNQAGGPPFRS